MGLGPCDGIGTDGRIRACSSLTPRATGHVYCRYSLAALAQARDYGVARYGMEVMRLCSVLDLHLQRPGNTYICGDEYTIADMMILPWFEQVRLSFDWRNLRGDERSRSCASRTRPVGPPEAFRLSVMWLLMRLAALHSSGIRKGTSTRVALVRMTFWKWASSKPVFVGLTCCGRGRAWSAACWCVVAPASHG